ncbi:MAG: zinc-ribbon domain-containing protein [Lachnospiraceae bacterium]|nr:zinc-ribbon domain-containing protein [Lachnospiraceae bacterium]
MFCPNCGKQISDNSKFCGFCGAVMTPPAAPVVEQPVAMPVVEQSVAAPVEAAPVVEQSVAAPVEAVPVVEQPVAAPVVEQPVAMPVTEQPTMAAPMPQSAAPNYQQPAAPMQSQPQQMYQQPVYQQPMAAPMQQQPQSNASPFSPVPPAEEKKKKGKAGLIVAIVVLLLVLAGGGVFVFMRMNSPAKKIAAAFAANDIDTVVELYEKVGDKEMDEVVSQAREYAEKLTEGYLDGTGEQDYKTVSNTLSKLQGSVLSGDRELAGWISTIESVEDSRSAFKLAESYKEAGSYVEALGEYAKVIKEDELNYAQAQQAIEETRNLYREAVIQEAKVYEESGNYTEAYEIYEEALTILEGDEQILSAISESKKVLYGTWSMDVDISEVLNQEMGDEFAGFDGKLVVTLKFDFNEDGTFKMYADSDALKESFAGWMDSFVAFSVNIMYEEFEEMGLSKEEADELVQSAYSCTMEEYIRLVMESSLDIDAMVAEMETKGIWETKGDKLYMSDGSEIDVNRFDIFEVSGDTLTLSLPEGATDDSNIPGLSYPYSLHKVN